MKSDEYYINEAIKQARKCSASEDVPVGAVIVQGGKIIARGYNQVEKRNNSTAHAEIIAIERAIKKVGYKHLLDCDIYVTLEPCPMCSGAIVLARLRRLVFGAFDPKAGAAASLYNITSDVRLNHRLDVLGGVCETECSLLLKDFFKKLRERKNG
ncbi:MAG TPA: tRNA adenosine(34) deaminase TadA [Candidatus Kapabacteria bacterium]|jgi:tRNA(adenine34) deaminase|nr:tRNA adenosine(34) deaminase TadA [Candidatus Kapabacteria bacterium]HOQ48347.1 tRNA adenosine(34) deaminase TadA [Candidatus Kapabacteria bacterium]HPP40606.1 tRNA adenosine(34) deaminase TadA [Candidatus Kapabacteria bacterium]HPU23514.1 tRNA adenosine(34) deaminase TadA [Candidatus Kapabacteria bacterium]